MPMLGFRELIGSDTNLVTSRHVMGREKASLPFDVRCSKTPLLNNRNIVSRALDCRAEVMSSSPGPNQYLRCENN